MTLDSTAEGAEGEAAEDGAEAVGGGEEAHEAGAYVEVFLGNDGHEDLVLEDDVHGHCNGQDGGDGGGGEGEFKALGDAGEDGAFGEGGGGVVESKA